MNETKWTDEQLNAINEKNKNILVAAAAGSGKTAVLVERIINKIINENVDIDKLLVVTFTNAAASEMRERILDAIYEKIEENPNDIRLQKQITLLNKASICTIHSFCLDVIRNYFYELDISANFRIGDSAEIELLKQDVLEELFEEKYIEKEAGFLELIDTYASYRGDEKLRELILRIYNYIQSSPFPEEWLDEKTEMFNLKDKKEMDFAKTVWGQILIEEYKDKIKEAKLKLENVKINLLKFPELEKFKNTIISDIDKLNEIETLVENDSLDDKWNKLYEKTNSLSFDRWPTDKKVTLALKEESKEVRDKVKKDIEKARNNIFICDSEQAITDNYEMYNKLNSLKNIINEFEEKFGTRKKERNVIDFHDIEHFALKILVKKDESGKYVKTEVANKLRDKFQEIAIDEYQDSNLVQEYILNSISNGNNIFMVGDVKQSIYRFRQARPELFLEKYDKYELVENDKKQKDEDFKFGKKIQLFKNFRSRKNVLDITNIVFSNIMTKKLGDIDYTEEEYLNLGAKYDGIDGNHAGKAELHIIDLKDKTEVDIYISDDKETNNEEEKETDETENLEPIENTLVESEFVANKIKELLKSDYLVWDKKKGYRKVEPKDIVILLRATSNVAPVYEKKLIEYGIPVFSDSSAEYLDSTEIQIIMSILRIINNPLQDIPLVTVLRSSIGNFTDNDLVKIRLTEKNDSFYISMLKSRISVDEKLKLKIDKFINMLEKWKKLNEYVTLDELIWQIYKDSNFYNYVGLLSNGHLRQANLKMLFEKAKQYESTNFKGLYNFINFIDKLKTSSKDMQAAKIIGENENVVRIMSIHKSKGLEFPVVFLSNTAKQFNMMDLNDNILLHQDLGFGPKYKDDNKKIEYNTLSKEAMKIKLENEMIAEEMRVLYVALTRAREKLYITAVEKDAQKSIKNKEELLQIFNEKKINRNLIKKSKSYLDWLELVYLNNKNTIKDIIEIYNHNYSDLNVSKEVKEDENIEEKIKEKLKDQVTKNSELENKIEDLIKWEYAYNTSKNIPTKTSVSKIKQENAKKDGIEAFINKEQEEENTKEINENYKNETLKVPAFEKEEKITGAQKGTLIHLILQKIDSNKEYAYEDIEKLIEELTMKNIINEEQAKSINRKTIFEFTQSELFNELKNAKEIYKEEPFYINISSNEIYEDSSNENILVQGIIDLYYINCKDELILVDYKTDYTNNEEELKEKYKVQLELYKKALEHALNRIVNKVYIYSTYLQKQIEM